MFYKYRLFWRTSDIQPFELKLFLNDVDQEHLKFIQRITNTHLFQYFIWTRAQLKYERITDYLFEYRVQQKLEKQCYLFDQRRMMSKRDTLEVKRGSTQNKKCRWKKRYVIIKGNYLRIYKTQKMKKIKYERLLIPGWCKIIVPLVEEHEEYYSFKVCGRNRRVSTVAKLSKDKSSTDKSSIDKLSIDKSSANQSFYFRVESIPIRKQWVQIISARIMDKTLRARYVRHMNAPSIALGLITPPTSKYLSRASFPPSSDRKEFRTQSTGGELTPRRSTNQETKQLINHQSEDFVISDKKKISITEEPYQAPNDVLKR